MTCLLKSRQVQQKKRKNILLFLFSAVVHHGDEHKSEKCYNQIEWLGKYFIVELGGGHCGLMIPLIIATQKVNHKEQQKRGS